MKKIKKYLLLLFLNFFSTIAFSNDWEFGSRGEHLIPLTQSEIAIKKEVVTLKLTKYGMQVNVKFTFDSPISEKKIIGFITPGSSNILDSLEPDASIPNPRIQDFKIKNFETKVNGKFVESHVNLLKNFFKKPISDKKMILEYKNDKENQYMNNFVYFFEANFQKGINNIEHNYLYSGSIGVGGKDFEYIVTTISKWKHQKVDDFELNIDVGDNYCLIPYTFWNDYKRINWEIVGEGRIFYKDKNINFDTEKVTFLKLKNGYVRYKTKNFSPDKEISIYIPLSPLFPLDNSPEGNVSGYKFKDNFSSFYEIEDLKKMSDFELDILRNYSYAFSGYEFSRKDLHDYFSQFFWYIPIGKNVELKYTNPILIKMIDKIKRERAEKLK